MFSQEVDFLSYRYKFLDKNKRILIPKNIYESTIKKYNFKDFQIKKYEDSLYVVMMAEFNDWRKARKAINVLTYKWEKLCFYTGKDIFYVKELAKKCNIENPYQMYEFLISENSIGEGIDELFADVKKSIRKIDENYDFTEKSRKQLLYYLFRINPDRRKLEEELRNRNKTLKK